LNAPLQLASLIRLAFPAATGLRADESYMVAAGRVLTRHLLVDEP